MIETIAYLIIVFAVLLVSLWYLLHLRHFILLKNVPGPTPLPLVGNALELSGTTVYLPTLMRYKEKYGNVFKIFIGFQHPIIMISDHDLLEYILGSTKIIVKAPYYDFFHAWLGKGLLTSNGTRWRKHRKIITPAFHFKILEQSVEVFERNGDILVNKLAQKLNGSSFDIYPYLTLYSLDVICETALGTNVNAQLDSGSKYVTRVHLMLKIIMERFFSPILQHESLYTMSETFRKEKEALNILHNTTLSVIRGKEKTKRENEVTLQNDDEFSTKKKLALLDLLMQSKIDGQPLSEDDIKDEVETFMFEGHDATAVSMGYTLYLLSKHPDVQDKVVEELRVIFAEDRSRLCTYADLQKMKYMEAVFKEAMRLYSPVPFIGRGVVEDIEYNGITIPKGTTLVAFIYGIHMDATFFPEPETFNPDRFIDNNLNTTSRYPYAYIPFSAGPRNCIGQKLATAEVKHMLYKVLTNYQLLPVSEHEPRLSSQTTLKSINGLHVRIKKRSF